VACGRFFAYQQRLAGLDNISLRHSSGANQSGSLRSKDHEASLC
jgi:hypothetical protein